MTRISTHGCRLNAYDSEVMGKLAGQAGLDDAIVVNTCAVTARAVRKAVQDIRQLRRQNPEARLIVTGCAAQTEPARFAKMPEVNAVIGNAEKMRAETWRGLAGGSGGTQVSDIMAETAAPAPQIDGLGTRARPTCRFKMAAIIAVPSVLFPMAAAIRGRFRCGL